MLHAPPEHKLTTYMNKIYSIIKDVLVYSVLGFILIPIKFIFWLLTPDAWRVLSALPDWMKGGDHVNLLDGLKPLGIAFFWLAIAYLSLGVFGALTGSVNQIMNSLAVPTPSL